MEILLVHKISELICLHQKGVFSHPGGEELFIYHAGKLGEIFFDEVERFLRNEDIDNESRAFLALKIRPNTGVTPEIWRFLTDDNIDAYVKVKLSQRIISGSLCPAILKYLRDESIHWSSRGAVAMSLRGHLCIEILHLLGNEQIDENVRSALIDTVPIKSTPYTPKVLEFLGNGEINTSVREMLALTLVENTSFTLVQDLLKSENIPISIRKTITGYCRFNFDETIFSFLKDESIHYEVRMSVITSLNSIELSEEILDFLKNKDIDYAVRLEFAFIIKKGDISPKVQNFIEDGSYDFNIRRNLLESLSSPDNVELKGLFDNLGLKKVEYQKSGEVNRWQCSEITGRTDICNENIRTLNFYYRQAQGSYDPHFEVISACIRYYIENGYSSIWNSYRIIGRHPHTQSLGNDTVVYKENMEFRSTSSIYADTIHLTHGSPEFQIPGSHFILGNTITRDRSNKENQGNLGFEYKMKHVNDNQFTSLDLDYFGGNVGYFISPSLENGLGIPDISIEEICERVIFSLKKAEEKILQNSRGINSRILDVLRV